MTPPFEMTPVDYHRLGDAYFTDKNFARAAGAYTRAMTAPPTNENDLLTKWAFAELRAGNLANAVEGVNKASRLNPDNPFAAHIRALIQFERGEFALADRWFQTAITLMPTNENFRVNYAHLLQVMGRFPEAEAQYTAALEINPLNFESKFYRSMTQLTQGKFREGFPDYELRYALYAPPVPRNSKPIWRGGESLDGKTILVCAEQGIGDSVQFARYANWLKRRCGAQSVLVQAPLVQMALLGVIDDVDAVFTGPELPEYDTHVASMSLPGISMEDSDQPWYGFAAPYLRVRPRELARRGAEHVGFCWRGNPSHGNDRFRSIPRGALEPLLGLGGFYHVNLQHDIEDPAMLNLDRDGVYALAQTIAALDLVITVDTAVAHIAGALGVPTWILLPTNPDWRWGLGTETTPWYPSARLFRQSEPLKWGPVITRVKNALEAFLCQRRSD